MKDSDVHCDPLFLSYRPMVGTRKSNADAHPGLVMVASQQKRRSKRQILADEASAKADAIATRKAILARERELLERIGSIEDTIQREDDALQAHAARPDLRIGSQHPSRKRSRTTSKDTTTSKKPKVTAAEEDYK